MTIARVVGCFILWLGIVPLCVGILPGFCLEKRPRRVGTVFLMGWMFMLAVFQLLAVPFIIIGYSFSSLCKTFMILMGLFSLTGVIAAILDIGNGTSEKILALPELKKYQKSDMATWIVFFVILLFQLVMAVIYMTPDGDDSYYVTHAGMAVAKDTMYRFNAYTGVLSSPDYRHALAPFSMFIGFLSKRSGLHVAIVAHTILPLIIIPLSYLAYYKVGTELFNKDNKKVNAFMVIIAAVQIFGGASPYTKETFLLTRSWQGKSILANLMIPVMFYLLILVTKRTSKAYTSRKRMIGIYLMMFVTNLAAALTTSLGLVLMSVLEFLLLVTVSVRNKKLWLVPTGIITLFPCFIYVCLYGVLLR